MQHRVLSEDTDPLAQLAELCGHRWESHVLLQLAQAAEPLRRTELAALVSRAAEERISDGQLDRSIRRLGERNLLRYRVNGRGYKAYQLTADGHQHAARLRSLVELLTSVNGAFPGGEAHPPLSRP
jgi:DNA-binding PadR family transcriptional regulator